MRLNPLKIGDVTAKVPIIQGGMGIGVSGYKLASAVAKEGAIGIISAAQIGYREDDFKTNPKEANIRALKSEIRKAKELSPEGIIGINIMVAMNNYEELVKAALEEKIDIIISGAGLPMKLPKMVAENSVKIAPIVSSRKAAFVILKHWKKRYNRLPDFIVVEGPKAGGHLGFKIDEVNTNSLEYIVKDVLEEIKNYNEDIPVIAAGGIYTSEDIKKFINIGASGVQMATRFIATEECDAHINFKKAFVNSNEKDIILVKSPVGLPGRAIKNEFIKIIENEKVSPKVCYNCLRKCDPKTTPYCISEALIQVVKGNVDKGLIFTGSNGYKIDRIVTVKELIKELTI